MSKFFIRRPIFAIVVSLIIVLLGLISLVSLPIAQYPQISPPTINLSASYTGANAETVNQTVAQVLENQLNGIEGMDYMSSTSSNDGSYSLSIVLISIRTAIRTLSMCRIRQIWRRTGCRARCSRRGCPYASPPVIWPSW